jgi:uncharacterized protein YehS (DUF1456 family)
VTTIRVKPKETPLAESDEKIAKFLNEQKDITELYQELSYAELKSVLENWLNPSAGKDDDEDVVSASVDTLSNTTSKTETVSKVEDDVNPFEEQPKKETEAVASKKIDDVTAAFDDLFNS